MGTPEGFSGLHRVLTGEDAKALGHEIARAAGRSEAQGTDLSPDRVQPSEGPSHSPNRPELSDS